MPKGVVNMARGSLHSHHHATSIWGQLRTWFCLVARHPYGRWVLVSLVFVTAWLYWRSLMQHGSFAPFVPLFTMSAGPSSISLSPAYAEKDWRPQSRVVLSMTSMPNDVPKLRETLTSLKAQSLQPDAIYVNLPFKNGRTGQEYVVPDWLTSWPLVKVLRPGKDYGPLTKLIPALHEEKDGETIVVTVDDDKVYPRDMLRHLVWYAEQDPNAAFGLCGWSFLWVPGKMRVVSGYASWYTRGSRGLRADVIQGACGNLYRRKFFDNMPQLETPHPACFKADDMWVSGYLAMRKIPRVLTPGPLLGFFQLEPKDTEWLHKDRKDRLSDDSVMKDWNCIQGVEQSLGPWLDIRRTNQ